MGSSFLQAPNFHYNPSTMSQTDAEFSGILEIHVHHARNINNICIYDNQDVCAKFSLTNNPDAAISTGIVIRGGRNPDFKQDLIMKVNHVEAVLKCEIYMLSKAKNVLEDQLLGFTLVPLSTIINKGKLTQDFSLSSTDLFHSPAGIVRLSLFLNSNSPSNSSFHSLSSVPYNDRITTELDLLDKRVPEFDVIDPSEYSRIEFPDIECVKQNQKMVSEYFDNFSFLNLGGDHPPLVDYEQIHYPVLTSPNESIQNSGLLGSSLTSLSDGRNHPGTSMEENSMESPTSRKKASKNDEKESNFSRKEEGMINDRNYSFILMEENSMETPTSNKNSGNDEEESIFTRKKEGMVNDEVGGESVHLGEVFTSPIGKLNLDAEQSVMQQQIMDMYVKSMQQFSESLANMKLPMDIDMGEIVEDKDDNQTDAVESGRKNKDSSRIFYGSRAFF
ncbi:hypothetical protein Leryth_019150 [Lithospermum erythrorhizon]|nr:hypothetical protein Leryth_019150 [Lithospermum erythrorhizon]